MITDYPYLNRQRILFHIPRDMFQQCFSEKDLHRLDPFFEWKSPLSNHAKQLNATWYISAPETHITVTGWDSPILTEKMLLAAPNLQVILHSAGSIRPFIPNNIWNSGIRIATCNDVLGQGVAETTLGLIIAGLKGFFPCSRLTKAGYWQSAIPQQGFGSVRELYEVTIGIIGASRTGRHVLRLLSEFDANVMLYDPTIDASEAALLGATLVDLDTLMRSAEVISLHAPALPELRHMLKTREFSLMKNDAIFINTARGMLVDETALANELQTGRISAILDVTFPEPPAANHPFRHLPNVILLPHIAGALTTGCLRQGRSVVDQLLEYHRGERMSGEISAEKFAMMA